MRFAKIAGYDYDVAHDGFECMDMVGVKSKWLCEEGMHVLLLFWYVADVVVGCCD